MASIAFIFPGQGSQYPGMGKSFFQEFPAARETVEEAEDLLNRKLFPLILEASAADLALTENSQIAIYVTTIALLSVVRRLFPQLQPSIYAGLSLGEYSALTAAGILSFQEGLKLVQKRGELMGEACRRFPGTMAAVLGLSAQEAEEVIVELKLPEEIWVANFNCPGQTVLSGTARGIEAATIAAKKRGAKRIIPLQVQGAFHSGLMRYAQELLEPDIHAVQLNPSIASVVMNISAKAAENGQQLRSLMVQQITRSVRWEQSLQTMEELGAAHFIEIGCGNTLTGFVKRTLPQAKSVNIDKVDDLKQIELIQI